MNERSDLRTITVESSWKGLPSGLAGKPIGEVGTTGMNVLSDEWPTPCAILREREILQNARVMAAYCHERGVMLAPHAKTSMAPQLLWQQVDAGAWALTVANVNQLRILLEFGFRRFIVANEIVNLSDAHWLAQRLQDRDDLEVFVFVDSEEAADVLSDAMAAVTARPLGVLIEMGIAGARCGLRDVEAAVGLGRAIDRKPGLAVMGVAGFEGVVGMVRNESTRTKAKTFGAVLADSYQALKEAGLTPDSGAFGTAGGSIYFDDVLAGWRERLGSAGGEVSFVLRSGCYITQDSGTYRTQSPLGEHGELGVAEKLRPAIEVVAQVISTPEPGFCVVNAGKRDVSYDIAPPTLLWQADPGNPIPASESDCVGLNDQHAMFRGPAIAQLRVGERVGLGISHPCTTFDKWRAMPLVDDQLNVRDLIMVFV